MELRRRRFLALAGLVPAVGLAGCSDATPNPNPGEERGAVSAPDLDALKFLAGLEVVAEGAYKEALAASEAGRLGELPAAGAEFLKSAAAQHGQCRAAVNALLKEGGRPGTEDPDVDFEQAVVRPALAAIEGWAETAQLARTIESALAATYLQTIQSTLRSRSALRLAGGIQATGQKRVAILNFMLGEYPAPDAFQKTDAAVRA